ncbi:uncharacterized protein LOC116345312 [Contarinia nasturtii]|uniref:uncharacterized protein LOC116345312 n=1 Tax=Contarinia nasturtii TaxID=265458 RepID=UPI0012D4823F|nr:uncharacterized protein LOC116345312 [Contarinia nasturtii]
MSVDISAEIIRKLEHTHPEIRTRAINNVQSKFQSCGIDLQDLTVDVNDLIKHLMHWFEFKPVTNANQIFEILLLLLKSKYQSDAVRILSRYNKRGDLQRIGIFAEDRISNGYYQEIIRIVNGHKVEFERPVKVDVQYEAPRIPDVLNFQDINANSYNTDGLQYETAWEEAGQKELQELSQLKSSLCAKNNHIELEHALQYFQHRVNDFPGEFFLQSPFVFMSLLQLIECEKPNFDYTTALTCCLKLTRSLARRVTMRRVSSMHVALKEHLTRKQITIGSYCYKTFEAVMSLLQNTYTDSNLACVNECFLILIEVVELVCKRAGVYSIDIDAEYHVSEMIAKLADFLRFIREMTSNYRLNGHKTNRNNSISILFLLCNLLVFKESRNCSETESTESVTTTPMHNESRIDLDISQKMRRISIREARSLLNHLHEDSLSNTASESTLGNFVTAVETIDDSLCKMELELALLDFPLKHYYPQVNDLIVYALKIDTFPDKSPIKLLLNLTEMLEPVVTLLRDPHTCKHEKILSYGLKSMDVLTLVESEDLTRLLFNAITSLTPQYNANEKLREDAETLFLHMLSYGSVEMKRLVYKLSSEKISFFFGCLMDGKKSVPRSYASTTHRSCLFDIPMTSEILAEIVCSGLYNDDSKIASYAEIIITLIIRTKKLLPKNWKDIQNYLTPVLPLLLCHGKQTTTFGQPILSLVHPDSELPTVILIKSNIALLFSRDSHTQAEALDRLIYLTQNLPNAEIYMPNLDSIRDVIPNNVCIVEPLRYSNNEDLSDIYEIRLIDNLLAVLQDPHTEPSIRHSTLTQLNIVIEDPIALNHFHEIHGHSIILTALDRSLLENSTDNYPHNAIHIIGILSKMCIRIPSFRRQIEDDIQTYMLILRSLFLFPTEDKFRRECAILLFSLAFSGYIVGGNKEFILPPVCKKLLLPIACEFSWKTTLEHNNLLELILACENSNHPSDTNSNHTDFSNEPLSPRESIMKMPQIWRYIRLTFNALWFGSLDQLIDYQKCVKGSKNTELDYKIHKESLSFNRQLCATSTDLEIVEGISQKNCLNYWLLQLKNATTWTPVTVSCAAIENFSNVDAIGHRKHWDCKRFLHSITRFCTIMPNNAQDDIVFMRMCRLLSNLVERDFIDVHIWILENFNQKQCIHLDLINNSKASTSVFLCNIRFIESILTKTIKIESKKIIHQLIYRSSDMEPSAHKVKGNNAKMKHISNLYDDIFDIALKRMDGLLSEKKLDELKCLVSLIRLLVASGKVSNINYTAQFVTNKLLKLILTMSLNSYVGANFNKDCLLAIMMMMTGQHEFRIEKKYIKYLSTLCGHVDFQIRTYSWSILLKIADTLEGAKDLVQEMNSLPGGLYACCLNTLFDETEYAIVRENAAIVFATLIGHRNYKNELDETLYPQNTIGMGCEWIGHLLNCHKLTEKIIASIKYLHVDDIIAAEQYTNTGKIVSCNLMRSYCLILTHILPLKGAGDPNPIYVAMHEISKSIPKIRESVNKSSILLLMEISELILQCFVHKRSLVELIVREFHVIQCLISFLNVDLLESIPKSIKHICWPRILKVIRRVALSSVGFATICEIFNQDAELMAGTVTLFIYGLSDKDMNMPIMRFITDLMIISQATNYSFMTFADHLNEMTLPPSVKNSSKKFIFHTDIISQSVVNWLEMPDSDPSSDGVCAAEIIFRQLVNFFEKFNDNSQIKPSPSANKEKCYELCCKTLETLLKCSEKSRLIATQERFMLSIVDQMENIYVCIGGSFTDYTRKSGNAKAEKYIEKLKHLLHLILCWYCDDCLQDVECIQPIIGSCQKFWPSIGIKTELQTVFLKMLLYLSNNSLPVCKTLSTSPPFSVGSSVFLHSIIEYCVAETGKPKTEQTKMETFQLAMQIVTNCCCCIEGRVLITKSRMLFTVSRLHPQVTRNQKPWPHITNLWLKLFEVFTRHADASKEAHLDLLCNLAESSYTKNRRLALEILRNMSFNPENRAALLSSDKFHRVMYTVLDKNEIGDEQLLILVAIWKLVAKNAKGKNIIKNSLISTKLRAVRENVVRYMTDRRLTPKLCDDNDINSTNETIEDLKVAIDHVINILNI